jgi:isopenicillin N synthase-like dioxygenase
MTNGIYQSVEHRATVNSEKERISLATFYGPSMQTILGPTPSLVTPERPAQFGTISVADYYDLCFSQGIRGKSYLNDIKITKGGEC